MTREETVMISLRDLSRFFRFYMAQYRIEHDISLTEVNSIWSYQLTVRPALLSQTALLRKVFKGQNIAVDETTGMVTVLAPVEDVSSFLHLQSIFAPFDLFLSGLVGSNINLQLLIAPLDREYSQDYTRAQKWEWLVSSTALTELLLVGKIDSSGLNFTTLFHSCHQSDPNRNISDDSLTMNEQWDRYYADAAIAAGVKVEASGLDRVVDVSINKPRADLYRFPCEDTAEAARLLELLNNLGVAEANDTKLQGSVVLTKLSFVDMADAVFSMRYSKVFNLFGADPLE